MSDPLTPTLFENSPRPDDGPAAGGAALPSLLGDLNPAQREAVTHTGGHCLVLAGAGSGKTRVLTHRIAWLVADQGVDPGAICAVTFTNKAAAEMRGRVRRLLAGLGDAAPRGAAAAVWLSTFHAMGLRLLREWSEDQAAATLGGDGAPGSGANTWIPPRGFAVYDRDASLALWRRRQAAIRISPRDYDPARIFGACSRAVSRLEDPASWDVANQSWERRIAARVWKEYRTAMRAAGAVDFDDLLVLPLRILSTVPTLRRRVEGRFAHLLVDEYQDTNRIQYRLVQALLGQSGTLMVVGDEDQSIYRWRGADLGNVLDFQRDFPGAGVVRLEQNYRSTQPILSAAGSLVARNSQRLGKSLWTTLEGGEPPLFVQCATDREEAAWIATKVEELGGGTEPFALADIAVLYRTNAQSRQLEEIFTARRIPHRVVGGQRFFARREVRDLLAWLQLLVRDDDVALARAIAAPSRGIGPRTLAALEELDEGRPAAASLRRLAAAPDAARAFAEAGFSPAAAERLRAFGRLLAHLRGVAAASSVDELIRVVFERSGHAAMLEREDDGAERIANVGELIAAAQEGAESAGDAAPGGRDDGGSRRADTSGSPASGGGDAAARDPAAGSGAADGDAAVAADGLDALRAFLDRLALLADADTDRAGADGVRLMTVHAAKGLEFGAVFLAGMEEELFPHATALADGDVEEERRLCYVGMTRARRRLLLSAARSRRINGRERWQEPSRFIGEIDPRHIVVRDYLSPQAVGSRDWAPSSFSGLGGRTGQRRRRRGGGGATGRRSRAPAAAREAAAVAFTAGQPTRPAAAPDLVEGAVVVHPMFGPGKVLEATGSGDKLKLEIRFKKAGTKSVIARFAKLQVPE